MTVQLPFDCGGFEYYYLLPVDKYTFWMTLLAPEYTDSHLHFM
ncbi:hypothetical protein BRYFOR_06641 [Marvinbryantia formatexigens DSM 14469]|uniref:Uncharacterized protein n=1 Tax=Marvinbryantia formatexigens DSM 14469 TaxID=478749 RepID=C6LCY3_9FIRM|nr:hypothetical protein BRYFOR_06641 [Marvinbryantia formatexigens DSM 14469]